MSVLKVYNRWLWLKEFTSQVSFIDCRMYWNYCHKSVKLLQVWSTRYSLQKQLTKMINVIFNYRHYSQYLSSCHSQPNSYSTNWYFAFNIHLSSSTAPNAICYSIMITQTDLQRISWQNSYVWYNCRKTILLFKNISQVRWLEFNVAFNTNHAIFCLYDHILHQCACFNTCLQCFDAVGWASGRESGL